VWMGDDDDAETVRLRTLLRACYDRAEFGNRVTRGFLVKEMDGKVLAQHNAEVCFQPLSTLKLLPYLHALVEVDQGHTTMASTVSWVQPVRGTPAEMTDASCLDASAPGMTTRSAPLSDALPTMMWESHGRTLDAVLARFGTAVMTRQVQSFGLRQTEMYSGCPAGGHPAPWANNVTTLVDLARMFEGVERLDFVKKPNTRELFRDNMIQLSPAPGTSYSSPITKRTTGPLSNENLRALVEREAGAAKASVVSQFMQHVVLRGKGGGGGPSGIDVGGSDFLEVSLPFKQSGKIVTKKFLIAWYVCHWRDVADSIEAPESKALDDFRFEIHAEPIRRALATW
jgi:Beta-lactamase enzyme family